MGCFCLVLSALCLCLYIEVGRANIISSHPSIVTRPYLIRRSTERRQIFGSCTVEEFAGKRSSIDCQQSFAQPILDLFAACGYNQLGELTVDRCRTVNGKTCEQVGIENTNDIISLYIECTSGPTGICSSPKCSTMMQSMIDKLNCCFRSFDLSFLMESRMDLPSLNELAIFCGITPPPLCKAPSSLTFTPSEVTTRCSPEELFHRRIAEVTCNPQVQREAVEIYKTCNIEDSLMKTCRMNEKGVFCMTLNGTWDVDVFDECILAGIPYNTSVGCSNSCRDALQTYRRDYGCCVNNTGFPSSTASYELWSLCGVDVVGECKSTLDTLLGSTAAEAVAATKTMTVILALLTLLV